MKARAKKAPVFRYRITIDIEGEETELDTIVCMAEHATATIMDDLTEYKVAGIAVGWTPGTDPQFYTPPSKRSA